MVQNDAQNIAQISQFLQAFEPLLQTLLPGMQSGAVPADLGKEIISMVVDAYKPGRDLEQSVDALPNTLQQLSQLTQSAQQAQQQAQQLQQQNQQLQTQLQQHSQSEDARENAKTQADVQQQAADTQKTSVETQNAMPPKRSTMPCKGLWQTHRSATARTSYKRCKRGFNDRLR